MGCRMRRRVLYACTGGLLSAGAPLGFVGVRRARRRHRWLAAEALHSPRRR